MLRCDHVREPLRKRRRELERRRLHAADAREVGEQPVPGVVAVAEDVALARLALLVGEQVPSRHVLHVHDVQRPVRVDGDAPEHEAAHEAGRAARQVSAAEHVGRVHAHEREPVRGQAQRLDLRLVLRVHVRDVEAAGREHLRLVGRAVRRRGTDGGDAGRVDDALDLRLQALLEEGARADRVDLEHPLLVARAQRREPGAVEHVAHPDERPPQRAAVAQVALHGLVLEPLEAVGHGAVADHEAQLVSAAAERAGHRRADEPGGACDEGLGHGRQSTRRAAPFRRAKLDGARLELELADGAANGGGDGAQAPGGDRAAAVGAAAGEGRLLRRRKRVVDDGGRQEEWPRPAARCGSGADRRIAL